MGEPVLKLEHVFFHYGRRLVLDDVNLTVTPGDFLGIVGPNGSGKSTLLKIVLGLLQPTAGSVSLFGQSRKNFRQWSRIGYVAQNSTAFNYGFPATVREVVMSGLTASLGLLRFAGVRERRRVAEVLEQTGVADLQDRLIGELSGGQQQRVFIARALVSRPELLILDEPTVGVDMEAQERFYELLETLRSEAGMTLMMVSHDIGVVTEQVDNVACLNKKMFFHGSPADFLSQDTLTRVYGPAARILHHAH
ncbi:metal ABC transporter ATP-binding protein [Dethiobacter alkaliphilus]|uniref:metal ABC transporter ATP-binding protein n=1 Tax=Dethiobacter alkaliphilus TaxID=427926 RepID=UPI00222628E3|nr:metal ABC transporter ATP-binding protein [Dethiobacter alkaliphilus]MCW3489195.1 metal ABC transporter ATP-binding protein [Dethiobacter alkaliphilus]